MYKVHVTVKPHDDVFSDIKILGKTSLEILRDTLFDDEQFKIDWLGLDDKITKSEYDYLVTIYSHMPLVTKPDINQIIEQMGIRGVSHFQLGDAEVVKTKVRDSCKHTILKNHAFLSLTDGIEYQKAHQILREKILLQHIKNGVIIKDIASTSIDFAVEVKKGTIIEAFNTIMGSTTIGKNCKIDSFNVINNSRLLDSVTVVQSNLSDCTVESNSVVGPFATLRADAHVGSGCRIGNYVEIKNSVIKDNVKAAHLTYIGDAEINEGTNVGCGTVFANYDGKQKNKTKVGKNVFIGANANLVAPLTIGDNCFIAAGSTITKSLNDNTFAIARAELVEKENRF